jgi:hypothetical protein
MYGAHWRRVLDVPPGRRRRHAAVTTAGAVALACATGAWAGGRLGGRGRRAASALRLAGAVAGAGWLAGTTEFAAARIVPGPRTPREVAIMAVTSAAIPPLAVAYWLRGWWAGRVARPNRPRPTAVAG